MHLGEAGTDIQTIAGSIPSDSFICKSLYYNHVLIVCLTCKIFSACYVLCREILTAALISLITALFKFSTSFGASFESMFFKTFVIFYFKFIGVKYW